MIRSPELAAAVRAAEENGADNPPAPPHQNSQISPFADEYPTWPVMEQQAFYGLAGLVVRTIEPHSEADPNALLLQFLAGFGNAAGTSPYYLVEGDKHRAKLYVVMSGATSKGRKGTSLGRTRQVMRIADLAWETNHIQSGLSSGEGLIFHVRDAVSEIGEDGK